MFEKWYKYYESLAAEREVYTEKMKEDPLNFGLWFAANELDSRIQTVLNILTNMV